MDLSTLAQTVFAGVSNGALYAFLGLGFAMVLRSTGLINFAQGDVAMLGGVLTAVLAQAGLPAPLALLGAVACCVVLSVALYAVAIRPAGNASMAQMTLITIGFSIILRGGVIMRWGSDPMPVPSLSGDAPLQALGVAILPQELWLIFSLIAVTLLIGWFFRSTVVGLAMRAGASNPVGASFVGIDTRRLGLVAFAASGLLGGLAGALWSPISYAQVDVGLGLGLKGFTAALLGGIQSTYGPILGGVLLATVESFTSGYISSAYQDTITFSLLLLALLLRPQGLLGRKQRTALEGVAEEVISRQPRSTQLSRGDAAMVAAVAAVLVVLGLAMGSTWLTSGIFAGITALVVMGLVLLTGYGGQLSLGQGAFMMIGAYASGNLTMNAGWPALGAMAVGAAVAAALAGLLGRVIFRLRGFYLSMASFGLLMITLSLAREWSSLTGGPTGLIGIPSFAIAGYVFATDRQFYFLVLAISLAVMLFCLALVRSRFGRALLAMRSSESAARACGVDLTAHKVRVFAVSAASASIAGSLYAHYLNFANPAPFGVDATISQLTALTAGGFLSLWGAYVGSAVVVAVPLVIAVLAGSTSSQLIAGLQYLTFGVLLIGIVHLQMHGAAGRRLRLRAIRLRGPIKLVERDAP